MMKERAIQVDHYLHKLFRSVCKSVCFLYWHLPSQCYINRAFNLLRIALLALRSAYQDLPSSFLSSFLVPVLLQRLTRPSRSTQFLSVGKLVGATRNVKVTRNNEAKGLGKISILILSFPFYGSSKVALLFVCGSVTLFLRRVNWSHLGKSHSKVILPKSECDTYQVTYSCRCRYRSKCRQVLFSGVLSTLPLVSQATVANSTSKQVS